MKYLPTETVLQIIGYLSKPDLMSVALIASRYSIIARPFLFKRIRLLFKSCMLPDWVKHVGEYPDHALMIKIIEIGSYWDSSCFERLQNLIQAAATLEELSIRQLWGFPLELLPPTTFPNLKKLAIASWANYSRLAVHFFAQCPNLINLEVSERLSELEVRTPEFNSILQQHAPSFMDRLRKFRGPPYFLHYMSRTGRALEHFSSTEGRTGEWSSYISKEVGLGKELLSLHVMTSHRDGGTGSWVERLCFSPSVTPSLFPNLRSVAWFRVYHLLPEWQPVSVAHQYTSSPPDGLHTQDESNDSNDTGPSGLLVSPNAELLTALKQLPHLRRVYLASLHRSYDASFPEVITAFIADLQTEAEVALPHLMSISVWAAVSQPRSYTWKKGYADSDDGKTHLSWISATNI